MAMRRPARRSKTRCIVHPPCRIPRIRRSLRETSYLGSNPINKRFSSLLGIGFLLFCSRTWAQLVVEITKGQSEAIPIAVVPFESPGAAAAPFDVAQLVGSDLARSGRFNSMDRKDMVEQPHTGAAISFDHCLRLH